ncbi:malonic semialdehyde reductase [uncultured Tateyamaria sp.]|uniref:malonic semialdehyde reductase n=1 Tax=uncultured Tateyamaria sp. TaxID=455651 RepID=UPI002631B57F|nr:malonic semialdehyde reductase [uncultured Tateyamaria sp.]
MTLDTTARQSLFTDARTANRFLPTPVAPHLLSELYDLMKWGPTSMNACPARLIFLTSPDARARLRPALFDGNVARARSAPVIAVIGHDLEFFDHLPRLFPVAPQNKQLFEDNETAAQITAFRNASMQGAYLIMAARAVGLNCGPMSGFDNAAVDQAFFAGTRIKSNFLCALGYADTSKEYPRADRFAFDEVCQVL